MRKTIAKILEIEKEQTKRYEKNTLARYNNGEKVHAKQMEFHRSAARNRWVFGGNRSGKTECGAVETVWRARGIHPYRENRAGASGWVVSVTYEVQREVAQSKILYYLNPDWVSKIVMREGSQGSPETGIIDTIYVNNVFGGVSKIGFKSADQGREKFQGASLDFVWFDEEPPFEIYEECKMRVLDRCGEMFGTMTPLKGLSWVYDEIYLNPYSDPDIYYITMEWGDNPFLSADEVEKMSRGMSGDSLETRRYGRFRCNEGLVYPEFDPSVHIIEPFSLPEEWQSNISIDPGLNNPLSCHFYYQDYDGNIYVAAEHYEKGKDITWHSQAILELAERLNWKKNSSGMLESLIDSAASQRTLASSKSVAELFFERGIAVNTKVNKDMFSGIATVKDYFSARPPRIFIFKNCVNLIRELKSYWWGGGDSPIKKDDHALDELRYYLMTKPIKKPPKEEKTMHQRYKENLLRRKMNAIKKL
ncbi:MAG: terminase family protein [Clostridia bacterium]